MAKKDTDAELLTLRNEVCEKMVEHYTKMQEAQKQIDYHSEQCEELRKNLIKKIVGNIKQYDLVAISINGKRYEGLLLEINVHALGHSVGFVVKDGKTSRRIKYKVGEDDFKIEGIVYSVL